MVGNRHSGRKADENSELIRYKKRSFYVKNISIMVNGWKMRTLPGSVGIMEQDGKIGLENGCVKMLLPGVRIHTGAVTVRVVT